MVSERRLVDTFWDLRDDAYDHPDRWRDLSAEAIFQRLAESLERSGDCEQPIDWTDVRQEMKTWRDREMSAWTDAETGRPTSAVSTGSESRDGFGDFLDRVLQDFRSSGKTEWANNSLEMFLDGLAAFAHSRASSRPADDQGVATWTLFADMIVAATGYE